MKKTQIIKAVSALSVALFVGGAAITVDASAKAVKTTGVRVTKITKNTHYKKSTFKKAHPKQGIVLYSNRYLTKHVTTKKTHVFYSTESVRVKKSTGKTATYRYVKNAKGSVKGWIWTGNLKGKQGKVTKVSNKTVIAPTTNVKIAKKTHVTPLKKTSSDPSVASDKVSVKIISDAVSNSNFMGLKNVATFRDKINQWGTILKNHPNAWDAWGKKQNYTHKDIHRLVDQDYTTQYQWYTNDIKVTFASGHAKGLVTQTDIKNGIKVADKYINAAKY
ncbi:hypothetical protein ACFQ44_03635 [Levilactobacillus lanxiensis]|uniref:Uncharacterized protein n=1 Tax=Levilactobacillus lanxiensis TaxID=2799568 RepID=A0ABW4D1Y1_9LACO|nr:hypothetical protein [Levilactobacillus lanxiensis]